MVRQHDNPGSLVPQDVTDDGTERLGYSNPFSQSEIDDLLYGSDRSVNERVERLSEIRDELAMLGRGEMRGFGAGDPQAMIGELNRAIAALRGDLSDAGRYPDLTGAMSEDPADHLDALSPDDIDARQAIIGEDEFYDDDEDGPVDDDNVFNGSDEFRPHI